MRLEQSNALLVQHISGYGQGFGLSEHAHGDEVHELSAMAVDVFGLHFTPSEAYLSGLVFTSGLRQIAM